jgi:FMN phosphatase YigB (HAD superfamily)
MTGKHKLVIMLDIDNTLYNNDDFTLDLQKKLTSAFGEEGRKRYWQFYEQLRTEFGYADYLGALQLYRKETPTDPNVLEVSLFMTDYPFAERVCPGALPMLEQLPKWGTPVILSDGDIINQPRKAFHSGISAAVKGNVLIYIHKEEMLDDVEKRFPAEHYIMVDDKLRLLSAIKAQWRDKVTTVHCRQGHYAHDPKNPSYIQADFSIDDIQDLIKVMKENFHKA